MANTDKNNTNSQSNSSDLVFEKRPLRIIFTNKSFILLFLATLINFIGSSVASLALSYTLYQTTKSATIMGAWTALVMLSFLLVSTFAGVFSYIENSI